MHDTARWQGLVPSAEQTELTTSARRHFATRFPFDRTLFDRPRLPDWPEVLAAGYPLVGVPEPVGAGSLADLAALLEEAGRALLPVPLLATAAAVQTELAAGLPVTERSVGSPSALAVAVAGRHLPVLDGVAARVVVLLVPADGGTTLVKLTPLARESLTHVDPTRPLALVPLDGTPAETHHVESTVEELLGPARVAVAADLVGTAAGALDLAVRHALDREQFGRPVGAFQAVKHRLANVYLAVERARSLTVAAALSAAPAAPARDADAVVLPLLAKAAAAEAALAATDAFVQVLGAMGVTFEADAHLYFRRARQTAPYLGTPDECYRRAVALRGGGA
ncbi:hypothetical protein BLA60_30930 [Actinophytocola xinjiangensis]|uniref:Acyl-CoA dehydrogenase/oxidase C-terminal domain-containing protein n=1 Tax=Actinophytocola xinjiangensis TaxID=485602 RepID=A0A7Z0WGJ7_9PSEU|nr:acyl-CoA dehydrogenase family protein [Actinophytocola xinjiangensis]OLF06678.1 hypothetical protein BLA60_30930 [Actinophytocola xinjiangensis]